MIETLEENQVLHIIIVNHYLIHDFLNCINNFFLN